MTETATCPEESAPPIRRLPLVLMTFAYLAVTAVGLMLIVPKFEKVFLQVKVPMPTLTLAVMTMSGFCRAHPIVFAALMTGIPASIHLWHPRAVSVGRVAIPLLFWAMWGWMVVGLFLPMVGSLESIRAR